MESWLVDVKRVRIPRPKFGSTTGVRRVIPSEPPKDYELPPRGSRNDITKATEDLRRALQDKL